MTTTFLQKIVTFVPPARAARQRAAPTSTGSEGVTQPGGAPPSEPQRQALDLASVRFITLVLDLGGLQPSSLGHAREAAIQYLQRTVAKEDFVAVYRIDHSLHLDLPLTQDKQKAI